VSKEVHHTKGRLAVGTLIIAFLVTSGCQSNSTATNSTATNEPAQQETVSKAAIPPSDSFVQIDEAMASHIKLEELQEQPISRLLTATGKVQFNEDQMTRILAPVNGQVLQLMVKVGDAVHTGDTLFFMKSREVAAAVTEHLESH